MSHISDKYDTLTASPDAHVEGVKENPQWTEAEMAKAKDNAASQGEERTINRLPPFIRKLLDDALAKSTGPREEVVENLIERFKDGIAATALREGQPTNGEVYAAFYALLGEFLSVGLLAPYGALEEVPLVGGKIADEIDRVVEGIYNRKQSALRAKYRAEDELGV